MSCIRNMNRYFTIGLMLTALSGIMLIGLVQVVHADERGFGHHEEFRDTRHGHDHVYPARGQYVERLPSGYRAVFHGRSEYYFYGGVWYRPYGARFVIIAPPFGIVVPILPPYCTTIMLGGVPYYYANEVYYTQTAGGYMVVEPPAGVMQAPPLQAPPSAGQMPSEQVFIYPRQGQSEQQQAKDRYECHSWAVTQTHFDPTQPPAGVPAAQMSQKRMDYQRAMGACLDARGYTVK
ncbi:MAG: DUF6515 family protein [Syntrophales bacterium]|jgi:hypothetical protein